MLRAVCDAARAIPTIQCTQKSLGKLVKNRRILWLHPQMRLLLELWAVARESAFSVGGLDSAALGSRTFESNAFCH